MTITMTTTTTTYMRKHAVHEDNTVGYLLLQKIDNNRHSSSLAHSRPHHSVDLRCTRNLRLFLFGPFVFVIIVVVFVVVEYYSIVVVVVVCA